MMSHSLNDVRYWTYNSPDKPVCILIHGITGSHEGFEYIIAHLKDFYVIVPDLPGFGESKLTLKKFSADELAKQTNEFVKALDLKDQPYLVGHSMGGLIVASMISQNPELFHKKTVLISPVATRVQYLDSRKIGELVGRWQYYLGKRIPKAGPRLVKSRLISRIATFALLTASDKDLRRRIYGHHFKNLDYISSIDYYHQLHKDINKRGVVNYVDSLGNNDICLIAGDKDNVTPISTERKLAKALGIELHVIKGVGHLLHYERPDEVGELINRHLR